MLISIFRISKERICLLLIFTLLLTYTAIGQKKYYYDNENYLNYNKIGQGDREIIFLHGFGASMNTWDVIIEQFTNSDNTLYLFDLKGFGLSSKPKDDKYSIINQSEIILKFIKENKLKNIILIGQSYGGIIALSVNVMLIEASKEIDIITIAIDCPIVDRNKTPFFIKILRTPVINRISFFLPDKFRSKYTLGRLFFNKNKITKPMIDKYTSTIRQKNAPYTLIKSAKQIIPEDFSGSFKTLQIIENSVLLICGKNDPLFPNAVYNKLHRSLVQSQLKPISNSGHLSHEENPDIVVRLIREFIAKNND